MAKLAYQASTGQLPSSMQQQLEQPGDCRPQLREVAMFADECAQPAAGLLAEEALNITSRLDFPMLKAASFQLTVRP